jgi:hypothetical protein
MTSEFEGRIVGIKRALATAAVSQRALEVARIAVKNLSAEAIDYNEWNVRKDEVRTARGVVGDAAIALKAALGTLEDCFKGEGHDRALRAALVEAETQLQDTISRFPGMLDDTAQLAADCETTQAQLAKTERSIERRMLSRHRDKKDLLFREILGGLTPCDEASSYSTFGPLTLTPDQARAVVESNEPVKMWHGGQPIPPWPSVRHSALEFDDTGAPRVETLRQLSLLAGDENPRTTFIRVVYTKPRSMPAAPIRSSHLDPPQYSAPPPSPPPTPFHQDARPGIASEPPGARRGQN